MTQSEQTLDRRKLLTAAQEKALCQRIQSNPDDKDAQEHLLLANIGMVRKIANSKRGQGVEVEDLIQEGYIALLKAAKTFDISLNFRLGTYVTRKISQAMQRHIENYGSAIRLPVYQRHFANQQQRLLEGREDQTLQEGQPRTEVQHALQTVLSLDRPTSEDEKMKLGDFLLDDKDTEEIVLTQALASNIRVVFEQVLQPRERRILTLRYGLDNDEDQTLGEIAAREQLTKERVRQIEAKALSKLRLSPFAYQLLA